MTGRRLKKPLTACMDEIMKWLAEDGGLDRLSIELDTLPAAVRANIVAMIKAAGRKP